MGSKSKSIKYKLGDVVETSTFAGPKVHIKISKLVDRESEWKSLECKDTDDTIHVRGFFGHFTRAVDISALKEACVPFTGKEKPSEVTSFTFDWQVTKLIKRAKQ